MAVWAKAGSESAGWASIWAAYRPAKSARAAALGAEAVRICKGRSTADAVTLVAAILVAVDFGNGASSRTRWALVPLKPKPLIPPRRAVAPRGQACGCTGISTLNAGHGMVGLRC